MSGMYGILHSSFGIATPIISGGSATELSVTDASRVAADDTGLCGYRAVRTPLLIQMVHRRLGRLECLAMT